MSTEPPLTDEEISAVAEQLKEHSGVYTRRDIIAAAAATGSLGVLGALGIDEAEASHGVGRAGEPGDPLEAVYANKIGDNSEPTERVVTDDATIGTRWSDVSPNVGAKYSTTEDITLHVDPSSGSDSNDGTQSSPVQTINEALSRVPKRIYHNVRIFLNYGDYTLQNGPRIIGLNPTASDEFRIVGHDSENPFFDSAKSVSDITIGYGLISGCVGGDPDGLTLKAVQIDGRVQVFGSQFEFRDCEWINGSGNDNQAIDGYFSKVACNNCDFSSLGTVAQLQYVFYLTLRNCTATSISGRSFSQVVDGCTVTLVNSDDVINNAANHPNINGGLVLGGPNHPELNDAGRFSFPTEQDFDGGFRAASSARLTQPANLRFDDSNGSRHTRFNNSGGEVFQQEQAISYDEGMIIDRTETDLSSVTGRRNGHVKLNDGTTGSNELYWWDDSASVWRAFSDPTSTI